MRCEGTSQLAEGLCKPHFVLFQNTFVLHTAKAPLVIWSFLNSGLPKLFNALFSLHIPQYCVSCFHAEPVLFIFSIVHYTFVYTYLFHLSYIDPYAW